MRDGGLIEWIGMFISILVMLLLSLRSKQSSEMDEEAMETQKSNRRIRQEPIDDEEPHEEIQQAAPAVRVKRVDALSSYAKRENQRVLSASYRLKNALEGFQQRRPIEQNRLQTAIEQRQLQTLSVSNFLRDDAVEAAVKKQKKADEALAYHRRLKLRQGMVWSQVLKPPVALSKEHYQL